MRYIPLAPKSTEYDRIEYTVDLLDSLFTMPLSQTL